MPLSSGDHIGAYEIISLIGAGGMGEVYRARDTRLERDVALKILPEEVAGNPERESRFLQEARAAGALNHPNIVAVYDVGRHNGVSYIVSELVEGESLRAVMARGPVPPRRAASLAAQIAEGLAAAHSAGIVHRDLKPENIMCARDGRARILDFGLAKHTLPKAAANSDTVTLAAQTDPGVIMGTVGYMSPEQVRGQAVDARSDIFSLGVILYEMLTGQRAFSGPSSVDTLSSILKEDPPPLDAAIPAAISQIVHRCLEKEPARRFQNAADLAFALQTLTSASSVTTPVPALPARKSRRTLAAISVFVLVAAAIGTWLAHPSTPAPLTFRQLTFRDGFVSRSLFQPDGSGFTYTATWTGTDQHTYTGRLGDREHRDLPLADRASLAAISSNGELALRIPASDNPNGKQLLALAPSGGGPHRDVAEDVLAADWSPDGSAMAAVRLSNGSYRLEYPIGHMIYEGRDFTPRSVRVSRDGKLLAVAAMRFGSSFNGEVGVFDLSGHYTALYKAPVGSVFRNVPLSWSANGKEVWFTSIEARYQGILYAANLQGKVRRVMELPGMATLEDVQRDGRVLVTLGTLRFDIAIQDRTGSHDLPWFGFSRIPRLAGDARSLIFGEEATQQFDRSIYRRSLDGGSAVKLSAGIPIAFSPSGRYIIAWRSDADPAYLIVPTGAGQERPLRLQGYELGPGAPIAWLPDEQNLVARAHEPGHTANRLVVYNIESGATKPITPELRLTSLPKFAVVRDGSAVFAQAKEEWFRFPISGGPAIPVKGVLPEEYILQCAADGKHVYAGHQMPAGGYRFLRVDPETGQREVLRDVPGQGLATGFDADISPDGVTIAYTATTRRSTLYLLTGVR